VTARAKALRSRFRVFAAPADQPRTRRATDVLLLLVGLLGLWLLIAAYPPSQFEKAFEDFLASTPGWLDPVWGFAYDLLWLWAIVLVVVTLLARRGGVALEAIGALVLGTAVALVCVKLAVGDWPSIGKAIEGGSGSPRFPAMRIAETGAVILALAPHLSKPLRSAGWWILSLGVLGGMLTDTATPGGNLAALLAALTAVAAIRLALGTSAGRPGLADVSAALAELGISATQLGPADRQVAGVVRFRARDDAGDELLVKVYGRDAYDSALIAKFSRMVWYRDGGGEVGLSRLQAVEHEALLTLLAARAGVGSREVVTAGETVDGDALLVLRGSAESLAELPAELIDDTLLASAWKALARLRSAPLAHTQLDQTTIAVSGNDVWLLDLGAATAAPTVDQLQTDRVQLLAATAAVAGTGRATAAAMTALGKDGIAELLPYLQSAALATPLRKSVKAAGIKVDDLRKQVAAAAGVDEPELVKLRRMTWWTIIQAALLFLAMSAVIAAFGKVDWTEVRTELQHAAWGWIVFGFIVAQLPRLTQAVATLGSVAARLPFGPVYMKELATCYLNLAMPSSIARMAVNVRFFQCNGLPGVMAVTSGAIDSFVGNIIQALIILVLLLFGTSSIDLNLSAPSSDSGPGRLLWIIVGLIVAVVLVFVFVERVRRPVVKRVKEWWPEVKTSLTALRSSNKLQLLILGNIATELLFSAALGMFARAVGYHINFAELVLINESVSLLSSFIPVPGGIGVSEWGLMVGLTSAGMSSETAVITVLLYRLSTFYLPPIWGFFAFRWLQRNRYL
jgi:glycosyltransferase 2 family protein